MEKQQHSEQNRSARDGLLETLLCLSVVQAAVSCAGLIEAGRDEIWVEGLKDINGESQMVSSFNTR